jgi:hypothetical protein
VHTRRHKGYPAIAPQAADRHDLAGRVGVLAEDAFTWLEERPKPPRAEPEVSGQISLSAIAKALIQAIPIPKPMVLIMIPPRQGE